MRTTDRNKQRHSAKAVLALLLIILPMLFQPLSFGKVRVIAEVSPGKIPPEEVDHYLANSTVQVILEYPRSFVLQETVGDLVFKVSLNDSRKSIDIYIPPEFKVNLDKSYVWTSINNSYSNIGIGRLSSSDKVAPNWYNVFVTNRGNKTDDTPGHGTGTIWPGNHTIRIFNVTAPSIVGQYFFKILTDGKSIGFGNFPSLIVSADPNPAYVSGTVRYGGRRNQTEYGCPINLTSREYGYGNTTTFGGGKVQATGITDDGRIVIGQAFLNYLSKGNYTIYGLAPGQYYLNATAATYAPGDLPYKVILKAGQSLHGVDIFLEHNSILTVAAFSRWMNRPELWGTANNNNTSPRERAITLEILDLWNTTLRLQNETTYRDSTVKELSYYGERDLDGHIPQDNASFVGGIGPGRYYVRVWVNGYTQSGAVPVGSGWILTNECAVTFSSNEQVRRMDIILKKTGTLKVTAHFMNSTQTLLSESAISRGGVLTAEAFDLDEVRWAGASTSVNTGDRSASVLLTGLFNSTRDYGLPPGTYTVIARLTSRGGTAFSYVSAGPTRLSRDPLGPSGYRITIGEGTNEISFNIVLQGGLNLTIYSVTSQKPFQFAKWKYPNKASINVEVRDVYGVEIYQTLRLLQDNSRIPKGIVGGLDDGTYSVYVFTYGYVQRQNVFFQVKRGAIADVSVQMIEGVKIEVTLVFQKQKMMIDQIEEYQNYDTYQRSQMKARESYGDWVPIRFEVYNSHAEFVGANATYVRANFTYPNTTPRVFYNFTLAGFKSYSGNDATRWINYFDATDGTQQKDNGLKPDQYTIKVYVPGYDQQTDPLIDARARWNMTVSVVIVLQRMGHLYGMVHTYNENYMEYTRISWVSVDAIGKEMTLRTGTLDGFYELWMKPGSYLVIFSLPGYQTQSYRIQIPSGSDVGRGVQLLPLGMST